jgi:hypothetical protein
MAAGKIVLSCVLSLLLIGILAQFIFGREDRVANEQYLVSLAKIVIEYKTAKGKLPDTFEEAHEYSHKVLPNRGDKYGHSLIYTSFSGKAFLLRSYGQDNIDNHGLGDDIDVIFLDDKQITREQFLAWAKTVLDAEEYRLLKEDLF